MHSHLAVVVWLVLGAVPAWGAFLWVLWNSIIRPLLIPHREIERLATDLIERFGDQAEEIAYGEEYGAWRESNGFEQGKWRRVRHWIGECWLRRHKNS